MKMMTKIQIKKSLTCFPNDWNEILKEEINKPYFTSLIEKVSDEYTKNKIYPPINNIYRALELTSFNKVKVVILGQDPYHEVDQANGLAFSILDGNKIPKSLQNIYKELNIEFGYYYPDNGDLSNWAKQGVLLLNSTLTVREGEANSHSKYGWQTFTNKIIQELDKRDKPIVFILWGNNAITKKELIHSPKSKVITCAHPSPLSANRGFFNSNCFTKCNEYLKADGLEPIDWKIRNKQLTIFD